MKWYGLLALALVLALVLTGCSGGSTESGSSFPGQTVSRTYAMQLALEDAPGHDVSDLAQGEDYAAIATVIETVTTSMPGRPPFTSSGPAENVSVIFTTTGGTLTPASGTALTDGEGHASVVLTAGNMALPSSHSRMLATAALSMSLNE